MPAPSQVALLQRARERLDLRPLVIHCNYLMNLASLDPKIRSMSIAAFRGELDRAQAIGAEYLVTHPGNYKGQSIEQGIAAFVLGMAEAASESAAHSVTILIENTAGSGGQIGSRLEELALIRTLAGRELKLPVGYCLDTCHLLASGFDIANEAGLLATCKEIGSTLGFENVQVIHANDSKAALGMHVDRHENIGKGHIGEEGFRRILTHPQLRQKAFILETPDEGGDNHRRDIEALKRLSVVEERPSRQVKSAPTLNRKPGSKSGASKTSRS